jgi:hypothetical protein
MKFNPFCGCRLCCEKANNVIAGDSAGRGMQATKGRTLFFEQALFT